MRAIVATGAALAASIGLVACSGARTQDEATGTSVSAVLGNDFTGNYLKIWGVRSPASDPKYPCLNEFEVCLGLDPGGITPAVKDLCPSDDTPSGTWAFKYVVFVDPQCTVALDNFGCVPTAQEWVHPGSNHHDVVCITRNADDTWDLCVMDPVTGAGSEACPPCITSPTEACSPIQ